MALHYFFLTNYLREEPKSCVLIYSNEYDMIFKL